MTNMYIHMGRFEFKLINQFLLCWRKIEMISVPSLIPSASEHSNTFSNTGGGTNKLADFGPGDSGHEMHARMEEAIEHALAIINGASKFAEEAQIEQVKMKLLL